jgi:RNA polymerase-interacting CarD/CdnL/TRCF family regulator
VNCRPRARPLPPPSARHLVHRLVGRFDVVDAFGGLILDLVCLVGAPPSDCGAHFEQGHAAKPHRARGGGTLERVDLSVGRIVVYRGHGVGRIHEKSKRLIGDIEHEVVLIELVNGLSVSLPLERARLLCRPLASESELTAVREALRQEPSGSDKRWVARKQDAEAKLAKGTLLDLAEVMRDSGARSSPTSTERSLFLRARECLAGEIAQVRGLDIEDARTWIDEQLARTST